MEDMVHFVSGPWFSVEGKERERRKDYLGVWDARSEERGGGYGHLVRTIDRH